MAIDFFPQHWDTINENYRLWWAGQLERPLIQLTLTSRDPGSDKPELPCYGFQSFYDLSVPAEAIIDRWDYELSGLEFLGDAFPSCWLNFGPGVIAAFLGAKLVNRMDEGTVWFEPAEILEPADIHLEYTNDSVWLKQIKDICRAAMQRWDGLVQVGTTDLGGALDILSVFRPEGRLLLDLYDHPEQIKRLIWELHDLWFRYFNEINQVLQPRNSGYSSWVPVYSKQPHYMRQSDFCYMIICRKGDSQMKKYRPEQIVQKLRQADVELGTGLSVKEVCRKIEVSRRTLRSAIDTSLSSVRHSHSSNIAQLKSSIHTTPSALSSYKSASTSKNTVSS